MENNWYRNTHKHTHTYTHTHAHMYPSKKEQHNFSIFQTVTRGKKAQVKKNTLTEVITGSQGCKGWNVTPAKFICQWFLTTPPALQNVTSLETGPFKRWLSRNETQRMDSHPKWLVSKDKEASLRHRTHIHGGTHGHVKRQQEGDHLQASTEAAENMNLLEPWLWILSLQEKINFWCWNDPVCGIWCQP